MSWRNIHFTYINLSEYFWDRGKLEVQEVPNHLFIVFYCLFVLSPKVITIIFKIIIHITSFFLTEKKSTLAKSKYIS